jgi:hypothetical protein
LRLYAAGLVGIWFLAIRVCAAQEPKAGENTAIQSREETKKPVDDKTPLTDRERAELLALFRNLQDRVAKLEAAQAATNSTGSPDKTNSETTTSSGSISGIPSNQDSANIADNTKPQNSAQKTEPPHYGKYTPNLGFKLADTEKGDLSVSIYTYFRYLNQTATAETFTDAFGNLKNTQRRQDFQLQKVQVKFLGWILTEKFRYFIYTWTSNPTQGLGAQVVVAGNLNYAFNDHFIFGAGIYSLPGVRTTEGNFPFWLSVDSRHIADEFFRPSYTDGINIKGAITDKLSYQAMLGNNLSILGVNALQINNKPDTFAGALIWMPQGDYGLGFGDFEDHKSLSTRFAGHFTRSGETRQEQPNTETFENTQIRLSDGTIIFTPGIFGPGINVNFVRYRMNCYDFGLKYHGYSLEGEYYLRWLDHFGGPNTAGLKRLFDHGFQLQATAMLVPKELQLYLGTSRVNGQFGKPWDFRAGLNYFPWKNKVFRWNSEFLYLHNSPVGYTSVPYFVGARGPVFHTNFELAF